MTTVSIVQPNYVPWLGLFDMIARADLHVFYDDEQFSRKGWANRNKVRGAAGAPTWLSVPVAHGQGFPLICETKFATHWGDWRQKHPDALRQWYRGARHMAVIDQFAAVIAEPFENLADLNIAVIEWMCRMFEIDTPMQRSSLMDIPRDLDTTARPLAVCQALGADRFLCGPTARRYIDLPIFTKACVSIDWHDYADRHPTYPQRREPFLPFLSALDFLIECGPGRLEGRADGQ